MRMCLNWADFAKNISFKSYAAIHLPQSIHVGLFAHIESLVWHCSCDRRLKELKFKVFVPNCLYFKRALTVVARKLACPCGHVFCGSKPLLTTRNASRRVMLVQQALETEEQAAKHRKTNRERVEETRALETKQQTAKCRKSNREHVIETCTCMVNTATICMYMHGTYPRLPGSVPQILTHYTCSLH